MTIHYATTVRAGRQSSKGELGAWAHALRARCRTPARMQSLARTLLAMRERSVRAAGLRLTPAELQQAHSRGIALKAEARAWAEEVSRAA